MVNEIHSLSVRHLCFEERVGKVGGGARAWGITLILKALLCFAGVLQSIFTCLG